MTRYDVEGGGLLLAEKAERAEALKAAGIAEMATNGGGGSYYEYHDGYDYIVVSAPRMEAVPDEKNHWELWLTGCCLVVCGGDEATLRKLRDSLDALKAEERRPDRALYLYFSCLLAGDATMLEDAEEHIEAMEERTMARDPEDVTADIFAQRKRLLVYKRYYEALFDLLEDLEENTNGFITKQQLRAFRLHTNRVDRLSGAVNNLRDYLTQVREAYQNQLDISLNQTMKLFTVITAVFLPLSLIAGWYGMNLAMPEYDFAGSYPVVIVVSALVVIGCLAYFKKKKWF